MTQRFRGALETCMEEVNFETSESLEVITGKKKKLASLIHVNGFEALS